MEFRKTILEGYLPNQSVVVLPLRIRFLWMEKRGCIRKYVTLSFCLNFFMWFEFLHNELVLL